MKKIAAIAELNRFAPQLIITNQYFSLCLQVQSFTQPMGDVPFMGG